MGYDIPKVGSELLSLVSRVPVLWGPGITLHNRLASPVLLTLATLAWTHLSLCSSKHSSFSLLVSVTYKIQPSHFANEETEVQRET